MKVELGRKQHSTTCAQLLPWSAQIFFGGRHNPTAIAAPTLCGEKIIFAFRIESFNALVSLYYLSLRLGIDKIVKK